MSDKDIMNEEQTTSQEQEVKQEDLREANNKSNAENVGDDGLSFIEENLKKEVADLKDKYLRLYSEFENYRRRTAKERLDLITTASEDLIKEILPIIDDFERAFKASEKESDVVKVREGNQLVFQKLVKTLENKGVKVMEDLIGNSFDADTQEAITQIPAPNEEMKGKVI
ncbi:nucleotide exchange factor GrpE, partial [Cecembia sp.]